MDILTPPLLTANPTIPFDPTFTMLSQAMANQGGLARVDPLAVVVDYAIKQRLLTGMLLMFIPLVV